MFAFVQPFGLSSPAGGPRILRSLLQGTSYPCISICTGPTAPPKTTVAEEVHLPLRPNFHRLERSRFAKYLGAFLPICAPNFKQKLELTFRQYGVTAIHAIPQGMDFAYAFEVAEKLSLPYYLNVHDELDYNLKGCLELPEAKQQLAKVWQRATGRMVISDVMGKAYCERFGEQSYTVVTDGISSLPSSITPISSKSLRVYFMGAVHLSYRDNFVNLVMGLDRFSREHPDWTVSFAIRGHVPFNLPAVNIPVEYLPWGTEEEVSQDFKRIDLLYLPLPFGEEYSSFSRYSLSTKMVTYLGSGRPILYHGPQDAAASQLLSDARAGVFLTSLNPEIISRSLYDPDRSLTQCVEQALVMARAQFLLPDVQKRFWKIMSSHLKEPNLVSLIN